jgi:phosphatidylserine/phosphatidylglycerophosphate/cardiolipin synthase-like enzyme
MTLVFEGSSSATLRALAAALRNGQLSMPLSPLSIARVAPACGDDQLRDLLRLSEEGIRAAHLALLLESLAQVAEDRMANATELVWTGPESSAAESRDTAVVVAELFRSASRSVLVSTFVVQQIETVFKPLAERLDAVSDLRVQIFLHIGRDHRDSRLDSEIVREFADNFRRRWPGARLPLVYYDPRALAANQEDRATWHAKVVVIDDEVALVTSANFTEWAQQRNVEAGVLVRSRAFANQLQRQFQELVQSRAVFEVPRS